MPEVRLKRDGVVFPQLCARCGGVNPSKRCRLVLPYHAWWRANPEVKIPVCARCSLVLALRSWATLVLMLVAALTATALLSNWGADLILYLSERFYSGAPQWLTSAWTWEGIAFVVLFASMWVLGTIRDRYLRGGLKVAIEDYGDEWLAFESRDADFLDQIRAGSRVWPQGAVSELSMKEPSR